MTHNEFIERIIDDGIVAATRDYNRPDQRDKLLGSVAGFSACREKSVAELNELLQASKTAAEDARRRDDKEQYWWFRCYELEVEWVCNCVSAILQNQGLPTIITPTARGYMKAAEVVGVKA